MDGAGGEDPENYQTTYGVPGTQYYYQCARDLENSKNLLRLKHS
jgi:hypothetical protein